MTTTQVLIVDDDPDALGGLGDALSLDEGVDARAVHPSDVLADDVRDADLILVDFELNHWPTRDGLELALQPVDGLALAGLLRRHASLLDTEPPTGIAILTAQLGRLADPLPPENRAHVLARMNNLEWVFDKTDPDIVTAVQSLALGISALPRTWEEKESGPMLTLLSQLRPPASLLPRSAASAVQRCNPPLTDLREWSQGLAVVRWLAQRVLPYPTFLWPLPWLAARLGLRPGAVARSIEEGDELGQALATTRYRGALAGLCGPRWWRDAVEQWLWDGTGGRSYDPEAVSTLLSRLTSCSPTDRVAPRSLVHLDAKLSAHDTLLSEDAAIAIRPDDWPTYADQAYVSQSTLEEMPHLQWTAIDE